MGKQTGKKKWLKFSLLGLAGITLVAGTGIYAVWGNEISTISSITKIKERNDANKAGDVYEMHVKGGFYLDEFVAQGGVKNDKELIEFVTGNITKGLVDLKIEESEIACSSFTAQTKDGDAIFARNYDLDQTNAMIVYTEGGGERHATVSSVDLKFLGVKPEANSLTLKDKASLLAAPYAPLDGMNDKGVSVGIYMTYQGKETVATDQNTDKPDITSTTLLRLILDYADDLDEAIEIAKKYDLHDSAKTSYHYMVADKSGRSAILEWVKGTDVEDNDGSARELVVTYNDKDQNIGEREGQSKFQWVTNFIIQPNYYEKDEDKSGFDRYNVLYGGLQAIKGVVKDEQQAMDILASVGRRKGFEGGAETVTVHSVVYNLSKQKGLWVSNEEFNNKDAKFEITPGDKK